MHYDKIRKTSNGYVVQIMRKDGTSYRIISEDKRELKSILQMCVQQVGLQKIK